MFACTQGIMLTKINMKYMVIKKSRWKGQKRLPQKQGYRLKSYKTKEVVSTHRWTKVWKLHVYYSIFRRTGIEHPADIGTLSCFIIFLALPCSYSFKFFLLFVCLLFNNIVMAGNPMHSYNIKSTGRTAFEILYKECCA